MPNFMFCSPRLWAVGSGCSYYESYPAIHIAKLEACETVNVLRTDCSIFRDNDTKTRVRVDDQNYFTSDTVTNLTLKGRQLRAP